MKIHLILGSVGILLLCAVLTFQSPAGSPAQTRHLTTEAPKNEISGIDLPLSSPAPSPESGSVPPKLRRGPVVTSPDPAEAPLTDYETVEALLEDYLSLYRDGGEPDEFTTLEQRIKQHLSRLNPREAVEFLVSADAPIVTHLMLSWIDLGLQQDRAAWESAMAAAIRMAADDPQRLGTISEFAIDRIQNAQRRADMTRFLMKRATDDRLLLLVARFSGGLTAQESSDFLWSRIPQDGAVEGLGYLVMPEDAPRLEAIVTNRPAARRALQIAYERTSNRAFGEALLRMRDQR